MELIIMKCLFILMGVIPVAKKMDLFKKRIRFNFTELQINEKEMEIIKKIIDEGEKEK